MTNELDYDEHLDRLGGELDVDAVLRDIYEREDVDIPWTHYVHATPEESAERRGQVVLDTFEEYCEDMTSEQVDELEQRLDDERTRRKGEAILGTGLLASAAEAILEFFQPREGEDGDGDDRDLLDDLESDPVEAVETGPVEDDLYGGNDGE